MIQQWTDSRRLHSLYLIEKPSFYFPLVQEITLSTPPKVKHNTYGVPSLAEWEQMWKYWDTLTVSSFFSFHLLCSYLDDVSVALDGDHSSQYFDDKAYSSQTHRA